MSTTSWLHRLLSPSHKAPARRPRRPAKGPLSLERLEDRLAPVGDFGFAFGVGATGYVAGRAVAADAAGNVYVTGVVAGTADFDPSTTGEHRLTSEGGFEDVFVGKYTAVGELAWVYRVGSGSQFDGGIGIAVDATGNVYITGLVSGAVSTDSDAVFPPPVGQWDYFLWKLDTAGQTAWVRRPGGGVRSVGQAVALDGVGHVYVTGYVTTAYMTYSVFVDKWDVDGQFVWAQQVRGPDGRSDSGWGITADSAGNAYVTGLFSSTVEFGPYTLTSVAGSNDVFVAKLDGDGNFAWARRIGDDRSDVGRGVAVDGDGNVYATGSFFGRVDFDPSDTGEHVLDSWGDDAFVLKLDNQGNFVWARDLGAPWPTGGADSGYAVTVDRAGRVYVNGSFEGDADFDPRDDQEVILRSRGADVFVWKLDSDGNYVWARQFSGITSEIGYGVAVDGTGNVYTTGLFRDTFTPEPSPGPPFPLIAGGSLYGAMFVAKLTQTVSFYLYVDSTTVTAGVPFDVYVLALDALGAIVPDYYGEVAFFTYDPEAMLPAPFTMRPEDSGWVYFPGGITFGTPGLQELWVYDLLTGTLIGYTVFDVLGGAGPAGLDSTLASALFDEPVASNKRAKALA